MKHCIIAVRIKRQYQCVFCQYEADIASALRTHHDSLEAAKTLVSLGDINNIEKATVSAFHRDWGFSWCYTKPKHCFNRAVLMEHCRSTGLETLHVFENGQWNTVQFEEHFAPVAIGIAA